MKCLRCVARAPAAGRINGVGLFGDTGGNPIHCPCGGPRGLRGVIKLNLDRSVPICCKDSELLLNPEGVDLFSLRWTQILEDACRGGGAIGFQDGASLLDVPLLKPPKAEVESGENEISKMSWGGLQGSGPVTDQLLSEGVPLIKQVPIDLDPKNLSVYNFWLGHDVGRLATDCNGAQLQDGTTKQHVSWY